MKLSNKLLIAFALSLVVVPLLAMVYQSRVNYMTPDQAAKERATTEHFAQKTKGLTSIELPAAFSSVNLADAKGADIEIQLISDKQFGVKIPDEYQSKINFKVINATLDIKLADLSDEERSAIIIYVYAPGIHQLNVSKGDDVRLNTKLDSLTVNMADIRVLNFSEDMQASKLTLNATNVESVFSSGSKIKSLALQLNNSNFISESSSYKTLSIVTTGRSKVATSSGYYNPKVKRQTIDSLIIHTNGKTELDLSELEIGTCSGSLSNDTQVRMPAKNLNQMFKKL